MDAEIKHGHSAKAFLALSNHSRFQYIIGWGKKNYTKVVFVSRKQPCFTISNIIFGSKNGKVDDHLLSFIVMEFLLK